MGNYVNHFFDIFSDHKRSLFGMNLKLLIFMIPVIILTSVEVVYRYTVFSSNSIEEANNIYNANIMLNIPFQITMFLAILLFVFCVSLAFYCFRNMLWYHTPTSLITSLKKTGKWNIFYSFALTLFYFLFKYALFFINQAAITKSEKIVFYMLLVIFIYFALSIYFFSISQNAVYDNSFIKTFKNSIILSCVTFPKTIMFYIVFFLPPFLCLLSNVIILIFLAIVWFVLIGIGVYVFVMSLYILDVLDKYINKKNFGDYYRKGLEKYGN